MRFSEGCPLVFTKEGDAYEHNGSFNIIACYFRGIVLHRQQKEIASLP